MDTQMTCKLFTHVCAYVLSNPREKFLFLWKKLFVYIAGLYKKIYFFLFLRTKIFKRQKFMPTHGIYGVFNPRTTLKKLNIYDVCRNGISFNQKKKEMKISFLRHALSESLLHIVLCIVLLIALRFIHEKAKKMCFLLSVILRRTPHWRTCKAISFTFCISLKNKKQPHKKSIMWNPRLFFWMLFSHMICSSFFFSLIFVSIYRRLIWYVITDAEHLSRVCKKSSL